MYDLIVRGGRVLDGRGTEPRTDRRRRLRRPDRRRRRPCRRTSRPPPSSTPAGSSSARVRQSAVPLLPTRSSRTARRSASSSRASRPRSSVKASRWGRCPLRARAALEQEARDVRRRGDLDPALGVPRRRRARPAAPRTSPRWSARRRCGSSASAYDDRPATDAELDAMRQVLAEEMADGALGSRVVPDLRARQLRRHRGARRAVRGRRPVRRHLRLPRAQTRESGLLSAIDELLEIVRRSGVHGEMWHLKAAGKPEWPLMEHALAQLQDARDAGRPDRGGRLPLHPQRHRALLDRARPLARGRPRCAVRPARPTRRHARADPRRHGGARSVRRHPRRRGRASAAAHVTRTTRGGRATPWPRSRPHRDQDPLDTALDILATERTSVFSAFHSMSEDNLRRAAVGALGRCLLGRGLDRPGRDAASTPPPIHAPTARSPASSGTTPATSACLTLPDAVRRMTSLPADTFGLTDRGVLEPGYAADLVVLDPDTVSDRATFADPHQLVGGRPRRGGERGRRASRR